MQRQRRKGSEGYREEGKSEGGDRNGDGELDRAARTKARAPRAMRHALRPSRMHKLQDNHTAAREAAQRDSATALHKTRARGRERQRARRARRTERVVGLRAVLVVEVPLWQIDRHGHVL